MLVRTGMCNKILRGGKPQLFINFLPKREHHCLHAHVRHVAYRAENVIVLMAQPSDGFKSSKPLQGCIRISSDLVQAQGSTPCTLPGLKTDLHEPSASNDAVANINTHIKEGLGVNFS